MKEQTVDQAVLERFFYQLQAINRHVRAGSFSGRGRQPTRVQWMILRHLQRTGGCSVGQLAERVDVGASAMSQMLDRLEKMGWILRQPDPRDARSRMVRLTPEGEQVVQEVEREWIRRLESPFSQLDPIEQRTLVELMEKFAHLVQKEGR